MSDKLIWAQALSEEYNVPLIGIEKERLIAVETPTQSPYSLREKAVGSVAEALALIAAGDGATLMHGRIVSADRLMTCALALSSDHPSNKQVSKR